MKYIKKFEARTVNPESIAGLKRFFNEYENYKNKYNYKDKNANSILRANNYNIPKEFHEDFLLLDFYYSYWSQTFRFNYPKEVNNYIKQQVKKMASNSIISKIENNLDLYFELKKQLDKLPKWSDPGSFDNINDAAVKYTYFILHAALKNVPTINNMIKFNI